MLYLEVFVLDIFFYFIVFFVIIFFTFRAFVKYYKNNKKSSRAKEKNNEQSPDNLEFLENLPFSYLVLKDNNIVKYNSSFELILSKNRIKNDKFLLNIDKSVKCQVTLIGDVFYKIFINDYYDSYTESNYKILYFIESDNTGSNSECKFEKTIVSLIFIDNYYEVLETMEEIRFPLLIALIDRKLNALAQQVGGIVKKFENDKYIFLFSFDKLEYLKEKKFDILEQVRTIEMGNKIPVTLSIGIGLDGKTLSQSMENARAAMDLALGRGGDQVLIKNGDKYLFYGGNSKEVGYNSRVRARVKAYALQELIGECDNVLIMGHRSADLDCFGSAIGIYKVAETIGKNCNIVINDITSNIKLLYDRLIESNIYKTEVFITGKEALEHISDKTLLVVVDTHRPTILECKGLYEKANKIVVFDHHRKSTEFIDNAVLTYHEPYASSTCELITEMIQYIKGIRLTTVEADALLAGITVDTKNFAFKTGAKTFEAAAYLRRNGADSIRVRMLFQYDLESYKAKSIAVNSAETFTTDMAIAVCPSNVENPYVTTAQAADELLNISGVKASFVLCKLNNTIIISARSLFDINVQIIMEELGGGGHQTVAGAQISDISVEEAKDKLKTAILKYLEGSK